MNYVTRRGDTIDGVARQFNVPLEDFCRVNHLPQEGRAILRVGVTLEIPSLGQLREHRRQMSNEKDEAVCAYSPTERHVYQVAYDKYGRVNYVYGDVVTCEACGKFIEQSGARWVTVVKDERRFMQIPQLIIQEQDTIDELL